MPGCVEEHSGSVDHAGARRCRRSGWTLELSYLLDSRYSDAVIAGEQALALSGRHPWALCFQVIAYARWGKATEARAAHNELLARSKQRYVQSAILVISAVANGELEDAVAFAESGYEERDVFLVVSRLFPLGIDLSGVPGFQAIFERMNFPQQP